MLHRAIRALIPYCFVVFCTLKLRKNLQNGNSFTTLLGHTVLIGAEPLMNLLEISYYENGVSDRRAHTTKHTSIRGSTNSNLRPARQMFASKSCVLIVSSPQGGIENP